MAGTIILAPWEPLENGTSKGRVVSVMAICMPVRDVPNGLWPRSWV